MSDVEQDSQRDIEFDKLNLLGKAGFLTGAAVRTTSRVVDYALHRAADIVVESERAFRQGRDPNIQDATILEEINRQEAKNPGREE